MDRQAKLRLIQQEYAKWAKDNPAVDSEYLATDEAEAQLIKIIDDKLNQGK